VVEVEEGARAPVEGPRLALHQARYRPKPRQELAYGLQVRRCRVTHRWHTTHRARRPVGPVAS
jgi:hypothetical protein